MFKIEVMVDDNKLAQALYALTGIARGQPAVVPVVNMKPNGEAATNGRMIDLFAEWLKREKPESLKANDLRDFLKSIGKAPSSYQHLVREAIKAHLITKRGKGSGMTYHWRKA